MRKVGTGEKTTFAKRKRVSDHQTEKDSGLRRWGCGLRDRSTATLLHRKEELIILLFYISLS